jgi:soluble lytic murein transglycosylase-like protein
MTTDEIKQLVISYAQSYGINPSIALAQMARESANFRQDVVFGPFVGAAGERGISQFTPATWQRFGYGPHTNAYNPDYALEAWGKYMIYLLGLFNWDYSKALTGYNGGEGHLTNPGRYGGPSQAALNYAAAILANAQQYSVPTVEPTPDLFAPVDQQSQSSGDGIPLVWLALGGLVLIVLVAR